MNDKPQDPSAKVSARRRLIRGAFAAPAALTLYSGSAFAAPSLNCVVKQQTSVINAPVSAAATPDNTWVRVPLYRHINGANSVGFVRRADVASLIAPLTPGVTSYFDVQPAANTWQCVFISGSFPAFIVGNFYTDTTVRQAGNLPTFVNFYAGVRIDGAGNVVGVQAASSANTALHTTCWTSIGGANPF